MKVILLHPDTHRGLLAPKEVYGSNSIVLLSRFSPLGKVHVMEHDAEELVNWLHQLDEAIQALNGN